MSRNSNRNRTLLAVKLASYGTVKVYKTNHIKLNANLLKTLGIRPGDPVDVFLDTEKRTIVIKSLDKK
jgi:bifunctional DNA-binding transcriptional regulator/antitoxin component of YhaV-PrlF toxin-antitoxin module